MRKAVVTGCDANFVEGAYTLLRSVRRFHPDVARYCIAPKSDVAFVQDRLGDLGAVFPAPRTISVVPDRMQPALLKLFTPLVDADIAVWIDCDMVMCRSAEKLWEVPPGTVVAVMDTAHSIRCMVEPDLRDRFDAQFPGLSSSRGFNGGLFAVRTQEWRDLPERYERTFQQGGYSHHPKIWDQPFLNALMQPNVCYLPFAYNAHHLRDYSVPHDVRLVHFTNVMKPWMDRYPKHEPAYYYWLKYGLEESRVWPLLAAQLWILAKTPQRLISKRFKYAP